ncbi:FecR domain-containing protein [Gellertiella hungarica]|uniref:FecR protein domain-containing protein n=1 Tax=Gellertiella hungarica TaxID=1572859 RepID=A0A7W6JB37_9HYPH|nr:FecR domain-containing protein [Gellertiella hungarica]MBB4067188.1 hypothetical protein [Gellertiella hungarica]
MKKFLLVPALALLSLAQPVAALAADWVVAKVSQPSSYTEDRKTWFPLKPGMTVKNQSWISTGPRGRVVLQRAKDRVTFQPNTLAGVYERPGFAVHTDFAQQAGTIRLEIDPKVKPHLAVQTPYLAAVVKGTVFSVTVSGKGATVGVDRGRVEVTDALSGERTGVRAGQKAAVDNNPRTAMAVTGTNKHFEPIVKVSPFSPMVPAPQAAVPSKTAKSTAAAATGAPGTDEASGTASPDNETKSSKGTDTGSSGSSSGTSGKGTGGGSASGGSPAGGSASGGGASSSGSDAGKSGSTGSGAPGGTSGSGSSGGKGSSGADGSGRDSAGSGSEGKDRSDRESEGKGNASDSNSGHDNAGGRDTGDGKSESKGKGEGGNRYKGKN